MATLSFQETDTSDTYDAGCSGRSDGLTTAARQATDGGSAGSGGVTVDPDNEGTTVACFAFVLSKPGLGTWDAGTWVVRINFSSGDAGTTLEEVYVCDNNGGTIVDVDSGGGGTSSTGLGQATTGGPVTVNVTQSNDHTPQSSANSQPHIVLVFTNTDMGGPSSVEITPSLIIDSPIVSPSVDITVPAGSLSFSGGAPSIGQTIPVPDGAFAFSGGTPEPGLEAETFFDDFSGTALDDRWFSSQSGTASTSVANSIASLTTGASTSDANLLVLDRFFKQDKNWQIRIICRGNGGTLAPQLFVTRGMAKPAVAAQSSFDAVITAIRMSRQNVGGQDVLEGSYWNGSATQQGWNGSAWTAGVQDPGVDHEQPDWIELFIVNDGANEQFKLYWHGFTPGNQTNLGGLMETGQSDWVAWSGVLGATDDPLWFCVGDPYTDAVASTDLDIEFVQVIVGDMVHGWTNGRDTLGGNYEIYHFFGFGDHTHPMQFHQDGRGNDQPGTPGGGWEGTTNKDRGIMKVGSTYYLFYTGGGAVGPIGLMTTTDPRSTSWTKSSNNPIITAASGDLADPVPVYTPNDPDGKIWWMFASNFRSGQYRIHAYSRSNSDPDSTSWDDEGDALDITGTGWESIWITVGAVRYVSGRWVMYYSGLGPDGSGSNWGWGVATLPPGQPLSASGWTRHASNPFWQPGTGNDGGPETQLNGALTQDNTVVLDSSAGFLKHAPIASSNDNDSATLVASRVQAITNGTTIEVYHSITQSDNASVVQYDSDSVTVEAVIVNADGSVVIYVTPFGMWRSQAGIDGYLEATGMMRMDDWEDKASLAWEWESTPVMHRNVFGQGQSIENPSFVLEPVTAQWLDVPDGTLTFTGYAPTVSVTSGSVSITVPAGSIAFTGQAPSTGQDIPVPDGTLTFTGRVPTSSQTITVPAGTLSLTGRVPVITIDWHLTVSAGSLAFTGQAPTVTVDHHITVSAGSLAFTGYAPTIGVGRTVQVPAGSLGFTGRVPSTGQTVPVSAGSLSFAGQAPSTGQTITVSAGTLTFTGRVPVITVDWHLTVPTGAIAFSGAAPTTGQTVPVPDGALTFTGYAPTATIGVNVTVPAGSLTFTGRVPTTAQDIPVPDGTLTFVGRVPTVSVTGGDVSITVPAGSLSFSGASPSTGQTVPVSAGSVAFAGQAPSTGQGITVSAASIHFTGQTPTIGTTIPISAGAIMFTGRVPVIAQTLTVPAGSLGFQGYAPTENRVLAIVAPAGSLGFTGRVPVITIDQTITVGAGTITFAGGTPGSSIGIIIASALWTLFGSRKAADWIGISDRSWTLTDPRRGSSGGKA